MKVKVILFILFFTIFCNAHFLMAQRFSFFMVYKYGDKLTKEQYKKIHKAEWYKEKTNKLTLKINDILRKINRIENEGELTNRNKAKILKLEEKSVSMQIKSLEFRHMANALFYEVYKEKINALGAKYNKEDEVLDVLKAMELRADELFLESSSIREKGEKKASHFTRYIHHENAHKKELQGLELLAAALEGYYNYDYAIKNNKIPKITGADSTFISSSDTNVVYLNRHLESFVSSENEEISFISGKNSINESVEIPYSPDVVAIYSDQVDVVKKEDSEEPVVIIDHAKFENNTSTVQYTEKLNSNTSIQNKKRDVINAELNDSTPGTGYPYGKNITKSNHFKSNDTASLSEKNTFVPKQPIIPDTVKELHKESSHATMTKNIAGNEKQYQLQKEYELNGLTTNIRKIEDKKQKTINKVNKNDNIQYMTSKERKLHEIDDISKTITDRDVKRDHGDKVQFMVQIAADHVKLSKHKIKKRYTGNRPVNEFFEDGWYKYSIGVFTDYQKANELRIKSGVEDAFVAVYLNDKRISYKNAYELGILDVGNMSNISMVRNIEFRIQIAANKKKLSHEEIEKIYKGNEKVKEMYEDNWYKYSIPGRDSYKETSEKLKKCSVPDAFIVAYQNEVKIPLSKAILTSR